MFKSFSSFFNIYRTSIGLFFLGLFFWILSLFIFNNGLKIKVDAQENKKAYINRLVSLAIQDLNNALIKNVDQSNNSFAISKSCNKIEDKNGLDYMGLFQNLQIIKDNKILCGYDNAGDSDNFFKKSITNKYGTIIFKGSINPVTFSDEDTAVKNYYRMAAFLFLSGFFSLILSFYSYRKEYKKNDKLLDYLTHMPSIEIFKEEVDKKTEYQEASIAIIDLDYFQAINETYGHQVGDFVIKNVSNLIKKWAHKKHICFRVNGEKFVILMQKKEMLDEIFELEFLLKSIKHLSIKTEDADFEINISATIGVCRNMNIELEDRRNIANMALKEQKKIKKGQIREKSNKDSFTNYDINKELSIKDIITIWKDKNIFFEYQPIVIGDSEMQYTIYEALIRLKNNDQVFYPGAFLSKIKNSAIEEEMTKFVVEYNLNLIKNHTDKTLSINIDNKSILQEDIFLMLQDFWDQNGKEFTGRLMIEILEYDGVLFYEEISTKIKLLRNMGYKIAIDDFGAGYSNFSHILKLEVDFLKIDGEIVKEIITNKSSLAIVQSIKFLTQELGIRVIAEFVSDENIYKAIKDIGIDNIQGYYISKPISEEKMLKKE